MNQEKFGEFIKKIRKENHFTQKDLANRLGVTYQAVSKWENGKNLPDISLIKQMAKDFSIDLSLFFDMPIQYKKRKIPVYLQVGICIILIFFLFLFFFFFLKDKDFIFKKLSTSCSTFTIYGSMAYNKEKSSIYISNIHYCGEEDQTIYARIHYTLYEQEENKKVIIREGEEKKNLTLTSYLEDIEIHIDDYVSSCKIYKDNHMVIEIVAFDRNDKKIVYEIPLLLEENCAS